MFLQKKNLAREASLDVNKEHWKETENIMSEFGLNVIWFEKFEDLPQVIKDIAN